MIGNHESMALRRRSIAFGAVATVVVLPFALAVARALRRGFIPIGDNGLLEIRSHDVLTRHHPLLGTWSSASVASGRDMNHPGPLLFDAVALPVKLLGGGPGMAIGVALVNLAAVALAGFAGWRLGGRLGGLAAVAASVGLAWTLGSELLIDVWQPHVLILPFFAFLLAVAAVVGGHLGLLPVAVGVGSFLLQTHLSYAVLVPLLLLTAAAGVLARAVRSTDDEGRPTWPWRTAAGVRALWWTAAVWVIAWVQPIAEQVVNGSDGNLARLARSSGSDAVPIGARLGTRLVGAVVALPPWWTRSSFTGTVPPTRVLPDGTVELGGSLPSGVAALSAVVVVVALLAVTIRHAGRARDQLVHSLGITALVALGAVWLTMLMMPIGVTTQSSHQVRWLWPVSVLVTLTLAVALVRRLGATREPSVSMGLVAVIAVFSVLNVPFTAHDVGPTADRDALGPILRLNDQLGVLATDETYLFDTSSLRFSEPFSGPFLAELRRRGIHVVVDEPAMVRQLGSTRRHDGGATFRLQLHETGAGRDLPTGGTVVASVDGLDATESTELDVIRAAVAAMPGIDADMVRSGLLAAFVDLGSAEAPPLPAATLNRYLELERRLRFYSVAVVSFPFTG